MKIARIPAFVLFMTLLVSAWACGKKAPPRLVEKELTVAVTNLGAVWEKNDLYLKGDIISRDREERVEGGRIYYARYRPAEAPCEGCPVDFHGFYEFGPDVVRGKKFSSIIPGRLDAGVYYFKVSLLGRGGAVGPPSKVVKVVVE